MRFIRSRIFLASAAALLAIGASHPALSADQASLGPVAATVNGTPITQGAVDRLAQQGVSQGHPDTPETRKAIIDQLALQLVIAQEAVKKGLDRTPEFAEQVDALKQSVLARAYVQDFIKNNPVSDELVKAEYERVKATVTGNEYKAGHILVETQSEANDIIAKLKEDPGAFAKLAKERSKDAGSKDKGGDLGWLDLTAIAPEFGAAVGKLEKGKFTQAPVQTQYGYHVILLEDAKPIEAPPLAEVKPLLTQQLQQQRWEQQLDALKATAKIEVVGAAAPAP
jgi:peptidyl-prolyl cis-trans isomerase C